MKKVKSLKGKTVAIVGMGKSWFDYNLAKSHGVYFDEVWAINAVADVIYHDRVFMMDPPSRFLDTDDAGGQTDGMTEVLLTDDKPIYTCELDDRCKNLVEYPLNEVLQAFNCHYLNNTVAYAIAVPETLYISNQIWSDEYNVPEMMNVGASNSSVYNQVDLMSQQQGNPYLVGNIQNSNYLNNLIGEGNSAYQSFMANFSASQNTPMQKGIYEAAGYNT
jgi:hypothetical protein